MLYICATPIGNLADISYRAVEVLTKADIILCEDTRNSQKLLNHYGISNKKLVALHEHNENEVSQKVLVWLDQGLTLVQISDAGTPGISDPGARLCNLIHEKGYQVSPIPGASAYISLVSVAGLIETPSLFYGFLPSKSSQRQKQLLKWQNSDYAVTIYESPHRILECLKDIQAVLGADRGIVMGRELTKQFETIRKMPIAKLIEFIKSDSNQTRGEFVLVILPNASQENNNEEISLEQIKVLELLASELPAKKAVNLTNKIAGGNKDLMYQYLLNQKHS